MIGALYSDGDVEVFLEEEEISKLEKETLIGEIIRVNKPEQQGRLTLLLDGKRARELLSAIGVLLWWNKPNNNNEICIFVGQDEYEYLREYGRTGARYNSLGNKVSVRNEKENELSVKLLKLDYEDYKGKVPRQTRLF